MTAATRQSRSSELLRPLIFLLSAAVLVFAVDFYSFQAATKVNPDFDVWWVAAAGRDILATGHVPQTNGHAVVDSDVPWVMHEWLFGPPFAWGLEHFGPSFFSLVTLIAFNVVTATLLWITIGSGGAFWLSVACCLSSLFLFWAPLSARPTRLAVFFPVAMAGLAFAPRFTRWHALAAVGLELVWANAHGSFPLGVVLLLISAFEQKPQRRTRLLATFSAALITLVNPYGVGLHRLVWRYLRADEPIFIWIHQWIDEYKPLWRSIQLHGKLPVGMALLLVLALWTLTKAGLRVRALLTLGLLGLSILQVRDAQWVGPLGVVLLAPALKLISLEALPLRLGRLIVVIAAASGLAIGAVANWAIRRTRTPADWYGWQSPVADLAKQLPENARVLVPFQAAGLVLWLIAPHDGRVLFDSRNDCYSGRTADDYHDLMERNPLRAGTAEILDRDGVAQVITLTDGRLGELLEKAAPEWQRTRTEGNLSTFERSERRAPAHDP
jgi:hypothetical protein